MSGDRYTETRVKLTDWIAFGKVNGDAAAAVVLVTDPGGSGTFYDLALVIRRNGRLLNPATAHLGDQVRINSLAMEGKRDRGQYDRTWPQRSNMLPYPVAGAEIR